MIFGSVCSGIEAASVAWEPPGWTCAFTAEIEAFPCAVLEQHWPDAPNLGDINDYESWSDFAIDVLVGGTPCQSFSVAGLRGGMDDPRGRLTRRFLDIARRYAPRWIVWENVPGVLSADGGRAFGAFLGGLGQLGYGFAYRILDAQYFCLAQRRERVFVVGCAGGAWQRAAAVLFDAASLRGDSAPSRSAGKDLAPTLGSRAKGSGDNGDGGGDLVATITKNYATHHGRTAGNNGGVAQGQLVPTVPQKMKGYTDFETGGGLIAHTFTSEGHDASEDGTGRGVPLIAAAVCRRDAKGPDSDTKNGHLIADTIRSHPRPGSNSLGAIAFTERTRKEGRNFESQEDLAYAVTNPGSGGRTHSRQLYDGAGVRRLTPTEVERLFGFPDGYTAIPWRGRPVAADSPRYRALGNSMAVPVVRWIGRRIEQLDQRAEAVLRKEKA